MELNKKAAYLQGLVDGLVSGCSVCKSITNIK